jgi:hypothetical protein
VLDAIEDLYIARWGRPTRRARFEDGPLVVEVVKWDEAVTDEGVTLYATLGGSSVQDEVRHTQEFVLGLSPARDEVARALASLAVYGVEHRVQLGHGDTVPSERSLWPGTEMRTFLVARPLPGFLEPLVFPEGLHVEFLQAIPLFETERIYKIQHGADALIADWETAGVAFWDPERSPHP